jgi:acylglycerol lipase
VRHTEGYFGGREGVRLFYQKWMPDIEAKATLVIIHGLAEHSGRYLNLVNYLVPLGYVIYAFDLRGHGKSEGKKGTVEHFSFYLDDLHEFLEKVRNQSTLKNVFLFGHSMGATISLAYSVHHQNFLSGLVLSGTAIRIKPHLPAAVITLLWPLALFLPELGLIKLDSAALSHNVEIVKSYDEDPLVFRGKLSARLTIDLISNMHALERQARLIRVPLLILHGESDRLTDPEGARIVFQRAGSQDKTLHMYPGLYHEILNEPQNLQVLSDMEKWLGQHV